MSLISGLFFPVLLGLISYWLGRRELAAYRAVAEVGSDLFAYSRGRLFRRMAGVSLVAATGLTLGAFELCPATTVTGNSIYLALLAGEFLALLVLPVIDLWETSRAAKPSELARQAGLDVSDAPTRRAGRRPRKRSRSPRPR